MLYQQSTAYAIEALGFMAAINSGESVKARDLAKQLEIPEQFLAKVLSQLVKKKFVKSTKGPTGGFSLAVDPNNVTLYRIMAAMDSLNALEDECVMGLRFCSSASPCAFHHSWLNFKESVISQAQTLTLTDLSKIVLAKFKLPQKDSSQSSQESA